MKRKQTNYYISISVVQGIHYEGEDNSTNIRLDFSVSGDDLDKLGIEVDARIHDAFERKVV